MASRPSSALVSHGQASYPNLEHPPKISDDRNAPDVTFVPQDPSTHKKSSKISSRLSRMLKRGPKKTPSAPPTTADGEDAPATTSEAQKRRQQVYQAQKRHRSRKAEYVKSLEDEVARLQHLDAVVTRERHAVLCQNQQMRELLASRALHLGVETMSVAAPTEALPDVGSAALDIRFDEEIGHERTFVDLGEMEWMTEGGSSATTGTGSGAEETRTKSLSATPPAPPKVPVKGNSWAAVDFILALEWPCQGHIHHRGINPDAATCDACQDESGAHGHALTATATVYESALPPIGSGQGEGDLLQVPQAKHGKSPEAGDRWLLPHAEIDKLVQMSEQLPMDDVSITPAQAYSAIKDAVPSDAHLRPCLSAMKVPLASLVECTGFGAFMPADGFWKELDKMIEQFKDVAESSEGPQ